MILQVGVKVFLKNKDGKYLLLKRALEKYKDIRGFWDIVGGRINLGNSLIENLRREVKEETGLDILSEPRLIYAQDIIPDSQKHVVRLTYIADTEGEPELDTSENIEYKWLTVSGMKNEKDLDIYAREVIEKGIVK